MAALVVKEIALSYIDSGPLPNETHATLFLLHGHTFYSPIFTKLLPLATKYNIRVVAITRRDYSDSTPLGPAELDMITHGNTATKTGFLRERALEIATFIDRFIQKNRLPKISADGAHGGIGLLGWSIGNVQSLSVVGLAQYLPRDLSDRLEPYFKTLILYDCIHYALGFPNPPNAYQPLHDPSIPPYERNARFASWVSGYFSHPGLHTHDVDGLEYTTSSQQRPPTATLISQDQLKAMTDPGPGLRCENSIIEGSLLETMACVRESVLFPDKDAIVWPRLKVACVWGTESTWSVVYGLWCLDEYIKKRGQSEWRRPPLYFVAMEGVNHFAHWENPEKVMDVFTEVLRS